MQPNYNPSTYIYTGALTASLFYRVYSDSPPPTYWGPGDVLPTHSSNPNDQQWTNFLQVIDDKMSEKFSVVGNKLDTLSSRMDQIKTNQKKLEEEIKSATPGPSNDSPSVATSGSGRRKRITPAVLQVGPLSYYLFQN